VGDLRNKFAKEERCRRVQAKQAAMRKPTPHFVPKCDGCGLDRLDRPRSDGSYILLYQITRGHYDRNVCLCENCLVTDPRQQPKT
jgi:hypothetical protein